MKCLIVIDVQNDFISGSLGTEEAQQMLPLLVKKIEDFDGEVWLTQDTHTDAYLETQEGRNLPVPHCVKGTAGWDFPEVLSQCLSRRKIRIFEKGTFGSTELISALKASDDEGTLESAELVGLCTDICVISNALMIKSVMPELPVSVDAACCAGVTPEKHQAALVVMASCQIKINNSTAEKCY